MKGIDFKLLRAFITLADARSYHHAAKILFITQPALSKQIKALEQYIGGALFQRGRHGATLTQSGSQLYPKAAMLLQSHLMFIKDAQEIFHRRHQKLILGFGMSTFHTVPEWIKQFRQQCTECEVVINSLPSSVQEKMLLEGSLDVGFARLPVVETLRSKILHTEKLILAVPSESDIAPDSLKKAILSYPLLQLEPSKSPCLAGQTALFLESTFMSTRPISATNDMSTLLALVAAGNGIAIVPESVRHVIPSGVRLMALPANPVQWDIGVIWNDKMDNPRRDDFLQIVAS